MANIIINKSRMVDTYTVVLITSVLITIVHNFHKFLCPVRNMMAISFIMKCDGVPLFNMVNPRLQILSFYKINTIYQSVSSHSIYYSSKKTSKTFFGSIASSMYVHCMFLCALLCLKLHIYFLSTIITITIVPYQWIFMIIHKLLDQMLLEALERVQAHLMNVLQLIYKHLKDFQWNIMVKNIQQ